MSAVTSAQSRGALPMFGAYIRAYPQRSALAMFAVVIAGLLDGLGLSSLLSMLTLATGEDTDEPSMPEQLTMDLAAWLGVDHSAGNLLIIATVLISCKAVLSLLAKRQVGYTVAYIATDLRLALIRSVMRARWSHYTRQSVGSLTNAVATEAERASQGFEYGAVMSAQILQAIIYLGIALMISWQGGVAAIIAGASLLLLLQWLVSISRRAGQNQTDLLRSVMSAMHDQFTAVKPLKAMAREGQLDTLLWSQTRSLKRTQRRQVISKEALEALQEPILAIMVGVGFFLSITVLEMPLASVLVMLFLLARVVNYLAKSQRAFQHMSVRESAYWSLIHAIRAAEAAPEPDSGKLQVTLTRSIRFERVSFQYPEGMQTLREQSLTIPAQAMVMIEGPSGAGKTTLLDLIVGLAQPDHGRIVVDDVPLSEIDLRHWRRQIGYVPQESLLVDESVAYNVTLGETDLSDADVERALRAADAWDFVQALPEGAQTHIGGGGNRLSGGQRQRLAIARALIHRPRLLVLDEATSNLDQVSEQAVIETIRHLKGQLTIVAVAHRGPLAAEADACYRLEAGELRRVEAVA